MTACQSACSVRRRLLACALAACLTGAMAAADEQNPAPGWREDFREMSKKWEVRGKPGVKDAEFKVAKPEDNDTSCLVMRADQASASLLIETDQVDLRQTPILRWRWRVTEFPAGADGRDEKKDDQAIGIYVNTGGMFSQKSVAYRWETETPVGATGTASYAGGMMKVKWFCLRNRDDGADGKFRVEERNVADDFQLLFGSVPKKIGIGISCNSQYTGNRAAAELDWIELVPAPAETNAASQ